MTLAAGLLLALASTAALNFGYFLQQQAASGLPALTVRRPLRSLRHLFGNLRWAAGFYVAALALSPLSLVQSTSAGGIGLLALLARTRVRREQVGVALSMCGLVLLGVSLSGGAAQGGAGSVAAVTLWLACSAVAALLAAFPGARLLAPGAGLAAAAGILYAAGDVGTKAAVHGGVRLAFLPALLACHGLAFVSLQLGFKRGGPLATAGVATLLTNSLPIVAGFAVFAESLPGGPLGFLRVLAFVLVVLGAAALGTRGAPVADAVPAQAPAAPPRDAREREVVRGRSAPVG